MADIFQKQTIEFVGEQEGFPEEELKNSLYKYCSTDRSIKSGYLAKVRYSISDESVALCLRTGPANKQRIASSIGEIFTQVFRSDQHLDIIYVSKGQEKELKKACAAFYHKKGLL